MADQYAWQDPDSPWFAKTLRAREHLDSLSAEVDAFLSDGYKVEVEPGHELGSAIYRLRMSRPVPVRFSTIIGDIVHNLRSALDCAAFVLARRHLGRELEEAEQQASQFPICGSQEKLREFFAHKVRVTLYGPQEQNVIRGVQPGWFWDEYGDTAGDEDVPGRRSMAVAHDQLTLLNRLSNIDKHRRLHLAGWWPPHVYWGSNEASNRRYRWGQPPFLDGSVLGQLFDDPDHPEPLPVLHHELELRIFDPPAASAHSVVDLLNGMHNHITGWVLPRVLMPSADSNGG